MEKVTFGTLLTISLQFWLNSVQAVVGHCASTGSSHLEVETTMYPNTKESRAA